VSGDVAAVLALSGTGLNLPALTERSLTVEVATALATHKGSLELDGLSWLPEEIAVALANHEGDLSLDGVTTLTDEAAEAMAGYEGPWLSLGGLTTLSEHAASLLRTNESIVLPDKLQ
jgi:hypothetical protein